eukprot:4378841-Pyramimonas_sp.AAC.1
MASKRRNFRCLLIPVWFQHVASALEICCASPKRLVTSGLFAVALCNSPPKYIACCTMLSGFEKKS